MIKLSYRGSDNMIERCYVMVKPGFVNRKIINDTKMALEANGVTLEESALIRYDEETARLHYIEKSGKSYIKELTDYLSEGEAYGMIFIGDNALKICRDTVEGLRHSLKEKYNLQTDVMRNILHCSSKTKVGDTMLELDTQREIALFHYLKNKE